MVPLLQTAYSKCKGGGRGRIVCHIQNSGTAPDTISICEGKFTTARAASLPSYSADDALFYCGYRGFPERNLLVFPKDYRVLKYTMNRNCPWLIEWLLEHLYLSNQNQTFRKAKRGPPESVPTFIWSFKCHLQGKIRIYWYFRYFNPNGRVGF